jgi:hypothetical protein
MTVLEGHCPVCRCASCLFTQGITGSRLALLHIVIGEVKTMWPNELSHTDELRDALLVAFASARCTARDTSSQG